MNSLNYLVQELEKDEPSESKINRRKNQAENRGHWQ